MTFTIADFLISISITVILIYVIKWVYRRLEMSATPMGSIIGCIILFCLVLSAVGGCSQRKRNNAESHFVQIKLVTTSKYIKIPKSEFVGLDTIYRNNDHVYKNDTGRDLIEYAIKYTKNGRDSMHDIYGTLIRPNQYFFWYDDNDYYMFCQPPLSTTVVTRSRYGKSHQMDFTYLHFLDYAENVPDYVIVPNK